jgi:enoyl-CoA hydratase/carnithine racemase
MTTVPEVQTRVAGAIGLITLNRPKALNALSLPMVRALLAILQVWRDDPRVMAVAICGSNKHGEPGSPQALFGSFCAGGDIRFFHEAALANDPQLGEFFTQEYTLNHLIQTYPKPYLAFMDGIVMGGGMGLCQGVALADPVKPSARQGGKLRIVTERTKMAMPETGIGLFPDVGGGYFLSRCPGRVGEYLALTGQTIDGGQAIATGLADALVPSDALAGLWESLQSCDTLAAIHDWIATKVIAAHACPTSSKDLLDPEVEAAFGLPTVAAIVAALEEMDTETARSIVATLRQRSPLMLHVVLEQVRRARTMALADDLRMERDIVEHCFHTRHLDRSGRSSETVEGIRALAIDKDFHPRWNPARIEDVTPAMVQPFFVSPWSRQDHPLRGLA